MDKISRVIFIGTVLILLLTAGVYGAASAAPGARITELVQALGTSGTSTSGTETHTPELTETPEASETAVSEETETEEATETPDIEDSATPEPSESSEVEETESPDSSLDSSGSGGNSMGEDHSAGSGGSEPSELDGSHEGLLKSLAALRDWAQTTWAS